MNIKTKNKEGHVEVELSLKFTFSDAKPFKKILDMVENEELKSLTLNVGELDYADSSALGMIMMLVDIAKRKELPLSLGGLHGHVEKLLKLAQIDKHFSVI